MALITCADCVREVSSVAVACPGCGRPVAAVAIEQTGKEYKVRILVGGLVVLIGWLLIAVGGFSGEYLQAGVVTIAPGVRISSVARFVAWWDHG